MLTDNTDLCLYSQIPEKMCKDDKGAKSFPLSSPECVTGIPATSLLPCSTSWLGRAGKAREPHITSLVLAKKKIPSPERGSHVVGHHSFVISSLPAIPGILHNVPLAQNSAFGRVRGRSGQGNHMSLAIIYSSCQVFPSQKHILVGDKKIFMESEQLNPVVGSHKQEDHRMSWFKV